MSLATFVSKPLAGASLLLLAGVASATTLQQLPRGARPGECFSRSFTPAVYRTDHVALPQPPVERWRDIPAVYNTVTRQELVSPARVDHENIPAVMGTRVHWIEHPGPDRVVEAPPVYRWVERQVMVSRAHLEWRPGVAQGGYDSGYGAAVSVRPTGEVMCRVLVPARYEIRRIRVLVSPGRTCVVRGPSTHERVTESYVIRPARTVDHPVAAVYRTVTDRVMVRGPRKERIVTQPPPRYVDRRVLVTPAHTGWSRIACAPPALAPVRYTPPPRPSCCARPQPANDGQSYGAPASGGQGMGGQGMGGQGYGGSYRGQGYRPDYAPQRPADLDGAPQPAPAYHAPQAR